MTLLMSFLGIHAYGQGTSGGETVNFKLVRIKDSQFNFLALKSKDILKNYSKILYVPMSAKNLVLKKSGDNEIDRSWKHLTKEDWYGFTSVFDEMFPKYFPVDKQFSLTDTVGADVLGVQFRLTEYTPRVNRKGELGQITIGHQESRNYGDLLITIMLIDSVSGDTIGVASDGIVLGAGDLLAKNSSTASQMIGWQRAYEIWLNKLRTQLESSHLN
ncbi:MAG: hypothetical protein U1F02_11175 [Cellvibrio sp.]